MKIRKALLAAAVATMIGSTPALAQSSSTPSFNSTTDWAKTFSDPKWAEAWTGTLDPQMLDQWMKIMMNPAMMESMMKMADPAIMNQWLGMMTNPQMMGALTQMADPTPYMKWMTDPGAGSAPCVAVVFGPSSVSMQTAAPTKSAGSDDMITS